MHFPRHLLTACVAIASLALAHAESYTFSRIAGMPPTTGSVDGIGNQALFNVTGMLALDRTGNLYVTDVQNHTIRKITAAGSVTTIAGTAGQTGGVDGKGTSARFNEPWGIAVDAAGNVWVADYGNHCVRKITPAGDVTTVAGTAGSAGAVDGNGAAARFNHPTGIVADSAGNLFVTDRGNRTIRKITPDGTVSVFAGSPGQIGTVNGTGSSARFNTLAGLAIDSADTLYAVDSGANVVRKITSAAVVTTLTGTVNATGTTEGGPGVAQFNSPRGIAVDRDGVVYVADSYNFTIRKVMPDGLTSLYAGIADGPGNANGNGNRAMFFVPIGLAVDASGTLFVADSQNHSIRKITPTRDVTLFAGGGGNFGSADGTGTQAQFYGPQGMTLTPDGILIVADSINGLLRTVTTDGRVSTFAGVPGAYQYVDGKLSAARFVYPYFVARDNVGNIFVSESLMNTVRRIAPDGNVRTYAGDPTAAPGHADGTGTTARFNFPRGLAVDRAGNVFVADAFNHTIRKIAPDGTVSTLAGAPRGSGFGNGVGLAARFSAPAGLDIDKDGVLYVADSGNCAIRKVMPDGTVSTLAGSGDPGSADGVGMAASFRYPIGLCVDSSGNVFVADTGNYTVRKITPDGRVTTIGGTAGTFGWTNGTGSAARFYSPTDIKVDAAGTLYISESYNGMIARGAPEAAPAIVIAPQSNVVLAGSPAVLCVIASGGGLNYQWQRNGKPIPGATTNTYAVPAAQTVDGGAYAVTVSNSAGETTSIAATLTVSTTAKPSRITNLAIRSQAGTAAQTLIVGFAIGGSTVGTPKPLLVRAVGPTLGSFGVSGTLADPKLEIYNTVAKITENDDWNGDSQVAAASTRVGAFNLSSPTSKDAALYNATFTAGSYTAQVSGKAGGTGIALAEIYDGTASDPYTATMPRLTNVSARTQVGVGSDILIAGFVVAGETAKTVLIRAVGPTLASFGVSDTLADPKLEVFSGQTKVNENDNWGGTPQLADAFSKVGAFRLGDTSRDAALVATLAPGLYTVQVSGVAGTSGVALIEVYEVP